MHSKKWNVILWVVQALLAALFLFAGITKLIMPAQALEQQAHMSATFLKFIGVCETLGGLGMILPGIFRTRRELRPIAAVGLVIIMIGAVVVSVKTGPAATAVFPAAVGVMCALVAYGRWPRAQAVVTSAAVQ